MLPGDVRFFLRWSSMMILLENLLLTITNEIFCLDVVENNVLVQLPF